jgi:hypothetical protein
MDKATNIADKEKHLEQAEHLRLLKLITTFALLEGRTHVQREIKQTRARSFNARHALIAVVASYAL